MVTVFRERAERLVCDYVKNPLVKKDEEAKTYRDCGVFGVSEEERERLIAAVEFELWKASQEVGERCS